jgi:hypothetical protein
LTLTKETRHAGSKTVYRGPVPTGIPIPELNALGARTVILLPSPIPIKDLTSPTIPPATEAITNITSQAAWRNVREVADTNITAGPSIMLSVHGNAGSKKPFHQPDQTKMSSPG